MLKSMSAPRENTARINKLVLVPGCKWQQTKMGKDLSDLLLQNKQVREVLRQGTENQNTFFFPPRNMDCYFSEASLLIQNCTQEPPATQKESILLQNYCYSSWLL